MVNIPKKKISIITSVFNGVSSIEQTINSVIHQDYENIEYIIKDGGSMDGTLGVIEKHRKKITKFVSEKDKGIYDGFNKGLEMATGDVIYFLNSGDYLVDDEVIGKVMNIFNNEEDVEVVYGWIYGKDPATNVMQKTKMEFSVNNMKRGMQPPHPAVFLTKKVYDQVGNFDTKYRSSADFDLLCRVAIAQFSMVFVDIPVVVFPYGGISSGSKSIIADRETRGIVAQYFGKFNATKYFAKIRLRRGYKSLLTKLGILKAYQRARERTRTKNKE